MKMKGLFDLDSVKYICSAVGEKKSIKAIDRKSGEEFEFKTRSDFWGRSKKTVGGWLATYNKENDLDLSFDDFIIEDIVVAEPLTNVLHTVKLTVDRSVSDAGVSSWKGFIGEGDSFRVELSTLKKYKDGRNTKPIHFEAVVDYLKKKYNPEIVTGVETDDRLITLGNGKKDIILLVNDKDYKGYDINIFDVNKPEEGVLNCSGLGKLWLNESVNKSTGAVTTSVKGHGRLFKYFQIISQDDVDNYKANCFSDIAWGEKSAYKALVDCKTDKEAWKVMYDTFNYLYPEPKTVIGWRGDEILIDAMYVFQEMMNMAHLHRWENDFVDVKHVLGKLGII